MACPFKLSKDNIELQFATNHIGHFLLTNLLLDTMKKTTRESKKEGRIVNVASEAHRFAYPEGIRFDKINDQSSYNNWRAYGQSKLANVLHANQLTKHLKEDGVNITANSLHPGTIVTNLFRHNSAVNVSGDPWSIIGNETNINVETDRTSIFERNKIALRLEVLCDNTCPADGVGVYNPGFWGMNIEQGKKYKVVFYARSTGPLNLAVSFTGPNGVGNLASTVITGSASDFSNWTKVKAVLEAKATSRNSRLQLTTTAKGVIWLDQVSAMPVDTYKGHGFRSDLFQMLLDMKPSFIRFPGGCFVEGEALRNAFRWKASVGPWEERPGHFGDVWKYWTDDGIQVCILYKGSSGRNQRGVVSIHDKA
ncbi:aspartate-semialdehyde dehydrogenase-like protein [Lathyrus oleraceus]|uniref:Aspartate-semialdehyde dehydrogenase-like protein n=1 Tax=Pisum sativum TaxID=3888 RepID=A0A9D4XUI6_PEA|nr:aspartate-semialdehyde dehydrogenase-like protein [Pisum sativum]